MEKVEFYLEDFFNGHNLFIHYLEQNEEILNSINRFPVADGDTGINFLITARNAGEIDIKKDDKIHDYFSKLKGVYFNNAKGNAGVILSQYIVGLSEQFEDTDGNNVNLEELVSGFKKASKKSYKSVMGPKEGTILTVMRRLGEESDRYMTEEDNSEFGETIHSVLINEVENTRKFIKEFSNDNLVDSGAYGFYLLATALLNARRKRLSKEPLPLEKFKNKIRGRYSPKKIGIYCFNAKFQNSHMDIENLKTTLAGFGDSINLMEDGDYLGFHIHTEKPEELEMYVNEKFESAETEFEEIKIMQKKKS